MHPLFLKTWVHCLAAAIGGRLAATPGFGMNRMLSANTSKKPALLFDMDGVESGHCLRMSQACHVLQHNPIILPWTSSITWYWSPILCS